MVFLSLFSATESRLHGLLYFLSVTLVTHAVWGIPHVYSFKRVNLATTSPIIPIILDREGHLFKRLETILFFLSYLNSLSFFANKFRLLGAMNNPSSSNDLFCPNRHRLSCFFPSPSFFLSFARFRFRFRFGVFFFSLLYPAENRRERGKKGKKGGSAV